MEQSVMDQDVIGQSGVYRHTQSGWVIRVGIGVTVVFMSVMAVLATPWLFVPAGIMAVVYWLFHSLTVEVDATVIRVAFGVGLIRRSIALGRVASCQVVRTPWIFGWGIRYVFNGWLWNVSGSYSVELVYHDGGHFRIGTDEPAVLEAAIDGALAQQAAGKGV